MNLTVSPEHVRLITTHEDGYRWVPLPEVAHLFKSHMSKHNLRAYKAIFAGVGATFEALPFQGVLGHMEGYHEVQLSTDLITAGNETPLLAHVPDVSRPFHISTLSLSPPDEQVPHLPPPVSSFSARIAELEENNCALQGQLDRMTPLYEEARQAELASEGRLTDTCCVVQELRERLASCEQSLSLSEKRAAYQHDRVLFLNAIVGDIGRMVEKLGNSNQRFVESDG